MGIEHEAVRLDFRANQQQSPEFLAINPNGKIPAITDVPADDTRIAEVPDVH